MAPPTAPAAVGRWTRAVGLLRLPIALLLLLWVAAPHWSGQIDDLYISLAYVHELVDHGQLQWSSGERVEGYSNFLWMVALLPAVASGLDGALVAQLLTLGAGLGLLGWLHRRLPVDLHGTALLVATAWWTPLSYWSVSGMEALPYALLLATGWTGVLQRRWPRAWVAGALAALCRPEGIAQLALIGLVRLSEGLRPRRDDRWLLGVTVALGVYHLLRIAWFGHVLPTPFLVKVEAKTLGLAGWTELGMSALAASGILLLAVLRSWRNWRAVVLAVLVLLPEALVTARVDGDWMGWGRLLLPGVVGALVVLVGAAATQAPSRLLVAPLALGALVSGALVPSAHPVWAGRPVMGGIEAAGQYRLGLETPGPGDVEWLVRRTGADERSLIADVGMMGNVPRLKVEDSFGLVDREIAELRADRGRRRVDATILAHALSGPSAVDSMRVAGFANAPPGPAPPEVRRWFDGPEEARGGGSITHWYRRRGVAGPSDALRWSRWETLYARYPVHPFLAWRYALALAEQGQLGSARELADTGTVRRLLGLTGGPEPALGFVDGPMPLVFDVQRQAFRLSHATASISRPVAPDEADRLRLELVAVEPGHLSVKWGRCETEQAVALDGALVLAVTPCGAPDRVAVRLHDGSAVVRLATATDPVTPGASARRVVQVP